ncbi:hypothetical protein PpBr36_04694, partial [Pyricularia pennisetigena]|uniref:hypothetical protein n=1 Tax=Pyricularia pennisetigena TaxID=1578925 RepID=UPI00114E2A49
MCGVTLLTDWERRRLAITRVGFHSIHRSNLAEKEQMDATNITESVLKNRNAGRPFITELTKLVNQLISANYLVTQPAQARL